MMILLVILASMYRLFRQRITLLTELLNGNVNIQWPNSLLEKDGKTLKPGIDTWTRYLCRTVLVIALTSIICSVIIENASATSLPASQINANKQGEKIIFRKEGVIISQPEQAIIYRKYADLYPAINMGHMWTEVNLEDLRGI